MGASSRQKSRFSTRLGRMQKELGRERGGGAAQWADERFVDFGTKINPQDTESFYSAQVIRVVALANMALGIVYLGWRATSTRDGMKDNYMWWWWTFFMTEIFLIFSILIGHSQRLWAVSRPLVTMDQIVRADKAVGANAKVSILLPTAGEKLDVVLKALLGASSQRLWDSWSKGRLRGRRDILRVVVLDEKRRTEVYRLTLGVHALASALSLPTVRKILQAEGLQQLTPLAFYKWAHEKKGFAKSHLYKDAGLHHAVALVKQMDALVSGSEAGEVTRLDRELEGLDIPSDISFRRRGALAEEHGGGRDLLGRTGVKIEPGFRAIFQGEADAVTLIYYSRKENGTPKISPKAGNMNAAIFPVDEPMGPALVGDSSVVVVNDARHQLMPDFLQRTVVYLFELDKDTGNYKWAKVAFVQTPQRFRQELPDDPLGNHAAMQYDVINHGKDGIGAVSSSGQGSVWRVAALKGVAPDGKRTADPSDLSAVGHTMGFRSEMLIEDTHTSIDLFRLGWRSVYVNEPGEVLAWCTHQPSSLIWRVKQVLRWHQGAVQLLLFKGLRYTSLGGSFPTLWHRIYAFDQATYYLQAIPGFMLLLMPVVYGITGEPPFATEIAPYFSLFVPFIVTASLPTVISSQWRGVDAERLTRDEQTWLCTTYIQIYAFLQVLWTAITRKSPENAWVAKAPTWPLALIFLAQFAAIGGGIYHTIDKGFEDFNKNLLSIVAGAGLAIYYLWPMVGLMFGIATPSFWYAKLLAYTAIGVTVTVLGQIPGIDLELEVGS